MPDSVVKYEASYDKENNILFCKFIGSPKSNYDAEFIANKNLEWYLKGGNTKVWQIIDTSEMGMAHPRYVNRFSELDAPNSKKYVIDYCTVCSNMLERIAAKLYDTLSGNPRPIFPTVEKAKEWVLRQQKKRGKTEPIQ